MKQAEIAQRLHDTSLLRMEWKVGDTEARFVFGDCRQTTELLLEGIHCFMIRQSTCFTPNQEFGRDCHVHFADTVPNSAFLKKYLEQELGLATNITAYDVTGSPWRGQHFVLPHHFCVVCDTCHIDVLCDKVTLPAEQSAPNDQV